MFVLPYIPIKNPLAPDDPKDNHNSASGDSDNKQNSGNSNNKYSNLRVLFPVMLILIALPLVVSLSMQQQNIRQRAASSDCNTGLSCTGCTASSSNTCSYGNGKETCTYQASLDGSACNPKTFSDVYCYLPNNCSNGFTCSNQQCVSTSQPTPTPVASTRPFPAPVTTQTINVPSTIDATGATDVTAALNSWITSVPNGSILSFKAGAIYKISSALDLRGKSNTIFEGNGATLNNVANANVGDANTKSFFATQIPTVHPGTASNHIAIHNFIAKAANPNPGHFQSGEFAAFLHVYGNPAEVPSTTAGAYFEVSNITASGLFGDLATFNQTAQYVWIHDNHVINAGRNFVSIVWASHVLIENNNFDKAGYSAFDIEPENSSAGTTLTDIAFKNNTIGTWSNTFVSGDGAANTNISNVNISGNTLTGSTLFTIIDVARRSNITFTNNKSLVSGVGPILRFSHVDGLTVTGNTQPLSSGVLTSVSDSTGVNITNNH